MAFSDDIRDDVASVFLGTGEFAAEITYIHDGIPSVIRAILDFSVEADDYPVRDAAAVAVCATSDVPDICNDDSFVLENIAPKASVVEDRRFRVINFDQGVHLTRVLLGEVTA